MFHLLYKREARFHGHSLEYISIFLPYLSAFRLFYPLLTLFVALKCFSTYIIFISDSYQLPDFLPRQSHLHPESMLSCCHCSNSHVCCQHHPHNSPFQPSRQASLPRLSYALIQLVYRQDIVCAIVLYFYSYRSPLYLFFYKNTIRLLPSPEASRESHPNVLHCHPHCVRRIGYRSSCGWTGIS